MRSPLRPVDGPECAVTFSAMGRMRAVNHLMGRIETFFSAFAERDWSAMGACYHDSARFNDPVFRQLDVKEVRAMWKVLLGGATDLRVTFTVLEENAGGGRVRWNAWYTFGGKRRVHNFVTSTFALKDGLILRQDDEFDFWRWSRQALGLPGMLLGWSTWLRDKVRDKGMARLRRELAPVWG